MYARPWRPADMRSLYLKLGILVVVALVAATFVTTIYKSGADSVRTSIERQNNAAGKQADDRALDYDACRDAGRMWNFGAGRCGGPASRGGN